MHKNIFIVIGHPDPEAFTGQVARWYRVGAQGAGHRVRILDLSTAMFDPILRSGYRKRQPLEPVLKRAQRDICWAHHLVFVYPNWWGSMPALLKGFFDRVFLPGFAFAYDRHKIRSRGLLRGKSARVILLVRSPRRANGNRHSHQWETVKDMILRFCGVHPVRMTKISPSEQIPPSQLEQIRKNMLRLGREAL